MDTISKTITAAAKRPIVPQGGYFETAVDAKSAMNRLLSMPGRHRNDIIKVLRCLMASTKAIKTSAGITEPAYKLVSMSKTPEPNDLPLLSSVLESLPPPSDLSSREVAGSDNTGRLAALVLMSSKTPTGTIDVLATQWKLKSGVLADEVAIRSLMVRRIVEAENAGVAWDNPRSVTIVSGIMQKEGWGGVLSRTFIEGLNSYPNVMMSLIVANAPKHLVDNAIQKEMQSSKKSSSILNVLSILDDDKIATETVARFMTDNGVPNKEKIALYEFLVEHGNTGKFARTPAIRTTGLKEFAKIKNQETFNVAMDRMRDGSDKESVREITGNLDFSLNEYSHIMDLLHNRNIMDQADPKFAATVEAALSAHHIDDDVIDDWLSDRDGGFHVASSRWNEMELNPRKKSPSSKKAILVAAILLALGVPMSIALFRANVSPQEFASNPDAVRMGTAAARRSNEDPEFSARMQQFIDNTTAAIVTQKSNPASQPVAQPVAQPAVQPAARPAAQPNGKISCEINRQLIDSVIMLEHVEGKEFSPKGAGGLMQLMPKTWEQINQEHFNGKYPFAKYHANDWVNRRFGEIYLKEIKEILDSVKNQWKTDQLPLIFACYHGGFGNMRKANFDPEKIRVNFPKTYDYMIRGTNLMGGEVVRK